MNFWNFVACAVIGVAIFGAYRWIQRQSAALGLIVALGLLARSAAGLAMFWISYLQLPVLPSLQLGDGFWLLMVDAKAYYTWAQDALTRGIETVDPGSASPFFVKTLAIWMQIVGVSGAAGLFLNVTVFVLLCVLLTYIYRPVGRWQDDLPIVVTVGALSMSPLVVIHATQPLKDGLFQTLSVLLCVGVSLFVRAIVRGGPPTLTAASGIVLALATYAASGIRAYYPLMVGVALVVALAMSIPVLPAARRLRGAGASICLLALIWVAYWAGSGPYFRPNAAERLAIVETFTGTSTVSASVTSFVGGTMTQLDSARSGFVSSGGQTNIAPRPTPDTPAVPVSPRGSRLAERVKPLFVGLGTIFVPVSLLKSLGIVNFAGGRGLLPAADLDTVVTDASLVWILGLLFWRRPLPDARAYVWFCLALGIITAVLLGYVVTNLGTLFRMRYLVATPILMLALALPVSRRGVAPAPASS